MHNRLFKICLRAKLQKDIQVFFNRTKKINKQDLLGFFYTSTQEKLFNL